MPTPGSFQGASEYGSSGNQELAIKAVSEGTKPICTVADIPKWSELIAKCDLKIGNHKLIYRDTPEDVKAYENAKTLIDAFIKSGRPFSDKTFHAKYGKLLGYTDEEIDEFLNRASEVREGF